MCNQYCSQRGFVRQSVGDDVSEERVNVIAAAYSLVGKVGYFWGGKSTVIGMDPSWGAVQQVSAEEVRVPVLYVLMALTAAVLLPGQ